MLKAFKDASSDSMVASEAFVTFAVEHNLFLCPLEKLAGYVGGIKDPSYKHHINAAREKQFKAISKNPQFVSVREALKEHRSKLSGLTSLSQPLSGEGAKSAISKITGAIGD